MVRLGGSEGTRDDQDFLRRHEGKPIAAILGSPPHEHSITAQTRAAGISGLPVSDDYDEMLCYLLEALPDFAFVFKPHPHSHGIRLPKSTRLLVTEMHPMKLLHSASVVVTNGTKLEMTAYLLGKPLVFAGNGLLWNTGAAKDCHTLAQIVEALRESQRQPAQPRAEDNHFVKQLGRYAGSRLLFFQGRNEDLQILYGEIPFDRMSGTSVIRSAYTHARIRLSSISRQPAYYATRHRSLSKSARMRKFLHAMMNRARRRLRWQSVRFEFWRTFRGKRVCLIGNAAAIDGLRLGQAIDACDIVVRFNVALVEQREATVGTKTDVRFVGVTLNERWRGPFEEVPAADPLWTFDKNAAYLRTLRRPFVAIPDKWQMLALSFFKRRHPEVIVGPIPAKPPRSGVVFLLLVLLYGRPRGVVLYGFTRHETEAYQAIYRANERRQEDLERYAQAHCEPSVEIAILQKLKDLNMITFGSA